MLATLVCLLAAAVVFVSLSRRLGVGSIIGFLVAGVVIGPSGLRLVTDVREIADISELGVLMLLFLIGLELRIQRIWLMRRAVLGLGPAQVGLTGAALMCLLNLTGMAWQASFVLGFGLALSSTAIVLPMLAERDLVGTQAGRDGFAVLLFQDLASIPLIALVPLLSGRPASGPMWPQLAFGLMAIAAILLGGRYLVRPVFRLVGGVKTPEVFTATALLVVTGAAGIADLAGLPMSLGAFAAGVVLADSEYRHELQADIEPFEGLLLGFFFISVGMSANIGLALEAPVTVLAGTGIMLAVKVAVAFGLARLRGQSLATAMRFALALPQGSEFGFVLFGAAGAAGVLGQGDLDLATVVVAASMLASPVLFALSERWLVPRLAAGRVRGYDTAEDARPAPVVICGFGRVGQIVGRVLGVRGIRFNALDADAENVDSVRRYGTKAYFGDPTRLDLLRAVGAAEARILVVALADMAQTLRVVELAKTEFPHLRLYVRARNRRHAHLLMDLGVEAIVRETFFSSLRLTEMVLAGLGIPPDEARRTVQTFREHDEQLLVDQHEFYRDESQLIQTAAQAADELRGLLEADQER